MTFFLDEEPLYRAAIARVLRKKGAQLVAGGPAHTHAADAEHFNTIFLLSPKGRILGRYDKDIGQFDHIWGNAASPVIVGDRVVLSAGPGARHVLMSLNKTTGDILWQHTLEKAQQTKALQKKSYKGSWSTPVIIQSGGKRLLHIISDVVDISRIDAGSMSINYEDKNLNELIDNLHTEFNLQSEGKDIEIVVKKNRSYL